MAPAAAPTVTVGSTLYPEGSVWTLAGGVTVAGGLLIEGDVRATSSRSVLLELVFIEDLIGLQEMRFSTDAGATWSVWEEFNSFKELELPAGDGIKTVLVEVRDSDGNVARASDTIVLDTSGPAITSSIADGTVLDILQTVRLAFGATDASGLGSVTATLDGVAILSGTVIDAATMLAGVHLITITATDLLGNVSVMLIRITVGATLSSLLVKFHDALNRGLVHVSQKNALLSKLNAAKGALEKGQTAAAKTSLRALSAQVLGQRGSRIDAAWADLFRSWVDDLVLRL